MATTTFDKTAPVDKTSPLTTGINQQQQQPTNAVLLSSAIAFLNPVAPAPFEAIRKLFDHLRAHPSDADALNAVYPTRGIFKTAAVTNPTSDQKLTIDLSPKRADRIPADLKASLSGHGLAEILNFFSTVVAHHVPTVMSSLGEVAEADLAPLHQNGNMNFRVCDYTPATADPLSVNGCGAHTDYGTFSIIFQDGQAGLEAEAPDAPGTWIPISGDATVVLCGWCALILAGGRVNAVRHRVRRIPGVRRLSAVLFVAPDEDVVLKPVRTTLVGGNHDRHQAAASCRGKSFSKKIMDGEVKVGWFKEVMGKRWRWREGNEKLEDWEEGEGITQDQDIEKFVFGRE